MDHPKFVIQASEAATMAEKLGFRSVTELLPTIVRSSLHLARPPISNFPVAAAGLSSDGRIFIGVNLEFPNLPLHHSVHAEQFLITNLSLHPETRLTNVVVSSYPCGHCRQFLQEIRGAPDIQLFVLQPDEPNVSFKPLSFFLPHRFGPDDLLEPGVPLILETRKNSIALSSEIDEIIPSERKKLVTAALEAAIRSHAPYSGCPSGVAVTDKDGVIYGGSYMESAAYNPSVSPAQAAVIAYLAAGKDGYAGIVGAVLVEGEGAVVKQDETVRLFFKAISPKCDFHVFHCKSLS